MDEESSVEESANEVAKESDGPTVEEGPVWNTTFHGGHDEDGHLTSDEVGLKEDDHDETDGEDGALHDLEKTGGVRGKPWIGAHDLDEHTTGREHYRGRR